MLRRFNARIERHPSNAALLFELPFDPKEVFGKVRAPVRVTIRGFSFCTTCSAR